MANPSAARPTRGRMSRIQQLPASLKERLDTLLRAGVPQAEILRVTAPLLEASGERPLSAAGLNRYASRMEEIGQQIREAREAAAAWTAKFGEAPTGELGAHIIDILRKIAFDLARDSHGAEGAEQQVETLASLALTVQRLERAAGLSAARERALRKELAELAAAEAEKAARAEARKSGHELSAGALHKIREQVYGIVNA